jgi:hypothetical protein
MHHAILWLTVLGGAAALAFGPFRLRVQAWLDRVRKALGWRKTLLLVFMALLLVGVGLTIGPEVAIAFSGDLFARQLSYVIPLVLARARSWAEVLARTCRAVIGARARRRRLARRGGVRGGTTEDPEPGLPWAVC